MRRLRALLVATVVGSLTGAVLGAIPGLIVDVSSASGEVTIQPAMAGGVLASLAPLYITSASMPVLVAGFAMFPGQTLGPVGCYRFDRPLGHSATGALERADSTWYSLRLLPAGAVARPELASPYWRDLYSRRSAWRLSHDTLFVRVFTGLVGWDLVLMPRDSGYGGVARYLSDALGGPPVTAAVHARREACAVPTVPRSRSL